MANNAETAVRNYLLYLSDPTALTDEKAVAEARAKADAATDPIEKLKAFSAVASLESVDGASLKQAFIDNARAFASENDIQPSAFEAMGVERSVLASAGLVPKSSATRSAGIKRSRVSTEAVQSAALSMADPFTVSALAERSGSTQQTASKVIKSLEAEGKVSTVGPDESHTSRGRAPILYRIK